MLLRNYHREQFTLLYSCLNCLRDLHSNSGQCVSRKTDAFFSIVLTWFGFIRSLSSLSSYNNCLRAPLIFENVWFRSIFISYCHFGKNKYQIHSFTTSNMDDFKTICIYENLPIFAYFFKRWEDFYCLVKNIKHFKISLHVPNTYF